MPVRASGLWILIPAIDPLDAHPRIWVAHCQPEPTYLARPLPKTTGNAGAMFDDLALEGSDLALVARYTVRWSDRLGRSSLLALALRLAAVITGKSGSIDNIMEHARFDHAGHVC